VKDGELILLKEQLRRHHQLKPITVRRFEDRFEVIEGEIQILALQELGYINATAIIIECDDDDKVAEIRQILQSIQTDIPYSVRLAAYQ
jgi:ParB-like chromosome segregation protein Spo0J